MNVQSEKAGEDQLVVQEDSFGGLLQTYSAPKRSNTDWFTIYNKHWVPQGTYFAQQSSTIA